MARRGIVEAVNSLTARWAATLPDDGTVLAAAAAVAGARPPRARGRGRCPAGTRGGAGRPRGERRGGCTRPARRPRRDTRPERGPGAVDPGRPAPRTVLAGPAAGTGARTAH